MNVKMTHPATVLTILFLILKLCGVIDWSWWIVFLPFYGALGLALVLAGIAGLIYWWEGRK